LAQAVEISFATRKLEKAFNEERELLRAYGRDMATKIKLRMGVLRSANNLEEIPVEKPTRRHELSGDLENHFAVDLKHPKRLILRPIEPIPRKADGGIDLSQITSIEIVAVMDYH
jgi:plasmid maintenance system killer protein